MKRTFELTDGQIKSLTRLINDEVASNTMHGDDAYNYYWLRIKQTLAAAKTS